MSMYEGYSFSGLFGFILLWFYFGFGGRMIKGVVGMFLFLF